MWSSEILSALGGGAVATGWRVVVGGLLLGVVGVIALIGAIVLARRHKLLVIGVGDPWTSRITITLWVLGVAPAFAAGGAVLGFAFACEHLVQRTHVTERAAALATRAVLDQVLQANGVADASAIPLDRLGPYIEQAPQALGGLAHGTATVLIDEAAGDARTVRFAGFLAARFAGWLVRSKLEDRMHFIRPVLADLQARDADGDGKVSAPDVVSAISRVHLEKRVAKLAFKFVWPNALGPFGIAAGLLLVPPLACLGVRRWRARRPAPAQ
jgi:hypothetical protein